MASGRSIRLEADSVSAAVYYLLYLLMLPITVLGYVIWLEGTALVWCGASRCRARASTKADRTPCQPHAAVVPYR